MQAALTAFEQVKEALCPSPVLHTGDFERFLFLQKRCNRIDLGTVLSQWVEGEEQPIAYASWNLLSPETSYSTTEREYLAIKWNVEFFCYYLLGRKFILIMDRSSLKWLQ